MGYLQRRISFLINQLKQGNVKFAEELLTTETGLQLQEELSAIRILPDGNIDLSSCSRLVRSTARTLYALKPTEDEQKIVKNRAELPSPDSISKAMRDYFQLLEDFFVEATGIKPEKFAQEMSFSDRIHRDGQKIAPRGFKAWETYVT